MELAQRCRRHWKPGDIALFEFLVTHRSWWDTVDFIASNLVGPYLLKYPDEVEPLTEKWKDSSDMWLIRTSILLQLKYREKTDFELLKAMIRPHTDSGEFFIRKAIGWALRQYAYTDAAEVIKFVESTEMSALSRREALKNL